MGKKVGSNLLSGILLIGLGGLLIVYLVVVNSLSSQIYTPQQEEFLSYNYGRSVAQKPPTMNLLATPTAGRGGSADAGTTAEPVAISPASFSGWENDVQAVLSGRYVEQDGVSVTVYDLDFQSQYRFELAQNSPTTTLELIFPFPGNLETLHEVEFMVDGQEPADALFTPNNIRWQTELIPGAEHDIDINYKADGASSFAYGLNQDRRTDKLGVSIIVEGLTGGQVPKRSLPTTEVETTAEGETFHWDYTNLVANRDIRLELPKQLSFAQRVAELEDDFITLGSLAPFLIGLFLAALAGLLRLDQQRLSLPGYLLIGVGLALFYPLLTFLSGLVDVILAAMIAVVTVSLLLLAFLGLMVGWRLAAQRLSWLLFIFLVVLSLGILTPWRGLTITFGGLLLLGTFMLVYARRPIEATDELVTEPETTSTAEADDPSPHVVSSLVDEPPAKPASPPPASYRAHCPQCGRGQADDFTYCPSCGYDGRLIRRCPACQHEQVIDDEAFKHCLHCGHSLM